MSVCPAAGQEAHDVVPGTARIGPEAVVETAVERKQAGGGELPRKAPDGPGGTRHAGRPARAQAVGEELHPRAEPRFRGQRVRVAGTDHEAARLGCGRKGRRQQGEDDV